MRRGGVLTYPDVRGGQRSEDGVERPPRADGRERQAGARRLRPCPDPEVCDQRPDCRLADGDQFLDPAVPPTAFE
jgi:hypothetical protein